MSLRGSAAARNSYLIAAICFALMALMLFPDQLVQPSSSVYWLGMQVGMAIGFLTAWPANAWLIRHGVKEAM